jgi:DNA-binding beta-propeller fold protein YncE
VRRALCTVALACFTGRAGAPFSRSAPEWRVVADVTLPGKAGRFDYQSFDATAGRLWIAHMGAGEVLAFDVRSRQVVARVPNLPGATGVIAVPALGRVFVSLSGSHEVAVLGAADGRVLARIPGGRFPDGLAYAPSSRRVFVSDQYGRQEIVIDGSLLKARRPIPAGGEVGNTQYDSVSGKVWIAIQIRNELAAIDPMTDSIVMRVAVPGIERPHGLVIDAARRLAYVAGEGNARLGIVDLRSSRVVRTYALPDDPDVLALDPGSRRLFVAAESGSIAAFDIRGDSLVRLPTYRAPHAHSVAVDPTTHLLYIPLEDLSGRPVLRIMALGPPSSFPCGTGRARKSPVRTEGRNGVSASRERATGLEPATSSLGSERPQRGPAPTSVTPSGKPPRPRSLALTSAGSFVTGNDTGAAVSRRAGSSELP